MFAFALLHLPHGGFLAAILATLGMLAASVQIVDRIAGDPINVAFVANGSPVQRLDKGYQNIAFIDFRLTGTLTLASYTTAPTKLVESIENLIAQLLIQATGKGGSAGIGTLKAIDFAYGAVMTKFMENTAPVRVDVGTTNAAFNFETNVRVYFSLPPKGRPIGSLTPQELFQTLLLDARFLSNFTATFQFRDQTALVTGGVAGAATLSNVQVTTQVREITGLPPVQRPFVRETQQLFDVTVSQLEKTYKDIPVGNRIRRITFKGTVGANSFSDPSDAPFNNTTRAEGPRLRLKENNAFNIMDLNYFQQRNANKMKFNLETMPTGYVVWEPASGRDTRGVERLDLVADVNFTGSNTNEIQATTQEVVG